MAAAPAATPAVVAAAVATAVSASTPAAEAAAPAATAPTKLLFASGKAELPEGSADMIAKLAEAAKTNAAAKLVISGFHDATGDPAQNAELAKQRAFAVRDALKAAGVDEARIELKKPEQVNGGDAADARRVEVAVQ